MSKTSQQTDFSFGTKAETLQRLTGVLTCASIEPMHCCRVADWQADPGAIMAEVRQLCGNGRLVVRSSTLLEDTPTASHAGRFCSVVGVEARDDQAVIDAVARVVASYSCLPEPEREQVLFQRLTENVAMAGVLLTRLPESGDPYYLINYVAEGGNTTAATAGRPSLALTIARAAHRPVCAPWEALLRAVDELEHEIGSTCLDIEFALRSDGGVTIFQVRPLAACRAKPETDDEVARLIAQAVARYRRFADTRPHLGGSTTILADMSDWNPSEIIGDRPHALAYSLYRYLVTDETWHRARTAMGYYDVSPAELMVSIGRKPYIDVRASFNSLTPAAINHDLRHRLVDCYLARLHENPAKQDKVEFEIVWSCWDFKLRDDLQALSAAELSGEERECLYAELRNLTIHQLQQLPEICRAADLAVATLTRRRSQVISHQSLQNDKAWRYFQAAHALLDDCRNYGTYHFAIMARLAFVARRIFLSLVRSGVLAEVRCRELFAGIETVATEFCRDGESMRGGQIPEVDFLQRYGHLRPGSYDITAPRYDSPILRALLTQPVTGDGNSVKDNPGGEFAFTVAEAGAIENALAGEAMPVNLACLLDFYGKTTRARERLKFEFTRNLSDALEYIARAGELLDLARETMADIHLRTVLKYRNPEESTAEALVGGIMAEVRRREQEREIFRRLQLPPVIAGEEDFYFIRTFHARPNFITAAHVVAPCAFANSPQELLAMDLAGRVLLIENADPGFDWIFTRRPAALITKYGGAASHMAIRCAELQLPAAIGIGERQFSELCHCFAVSLDCALGILTPATTSAPPA